MSSPVSKKTKTGKGVGDAVVIGAALAAGGIGVYMAVRKPPAIYLGDKVSVSYLSFKYKGLEADLFLCWGLCKGYGDFNNGDNLVGGLWTWGGPIHVSDSSVAKAYKLNPQKELVKKPIFILDSASVEPKNYQTYVWVTMNEAFVDRDKEFLKIVFGPWIDVKARE